MLGAMPSTVSFRLTVEAIVRTHSDRCRRQENQNENCLAFNMRSITKFRHKNQRIRPLLQCERYNFARCRIHIESVCSAGRAVGD